MQRLLIEVRCQAQGSCALLTETEHVFGQVTAIDVEAGRQVRDQESSCAAGGIESWLAEPLNEGLIQADLWARRVELGPPSCDKTVVPDDRFFRHDPLAASANTRAPKAGGLAEYPGRSPSLLKGESLGQPKASIAPTSISVGHGGLLVALGPRAPRSALKGSLNTRKGSRLAGR
jgi:hypothetical protein